MLPRLDAAQTKHAVAIAIARAAQAPEMSAVGVFRVPGPRLDPPEVGHAVDALLAILDKSPRSVAFLDWPHSHRT